MSRLLPSQIEDLNELLGDPAVQTRVATGIDEEKTDLFQKNSDSFARDNQILLHGKPYMLMFNPEMQPTSEKLSVEIIEKGLEKGKGLFVVNEHLEIITVNAEEPHYVNCFTLSTTYQALLSLFERNVRTDYLCGKNIDTRQIGQNFQMNPTKRFFRPMKDFQKILHDHFENSIKNEKGCSYWQDKKNRILMTGKPKTEHIFQQNLLFWLKLFLIDKVLIVAEPSGFGQDKTDITIQTDQGTYIIEIKWLGKNASGTPYGESRIGDGLRQVKIYLENDPSIMLGHLVIYDARPKNIHLTECNYNASDLHPRCERPHIIFLESETPSTLALTS